MSFGIPLLCIWHFCARAHMGAREHVSLTVSIFRLSQQNSSYITVPGDVVTNAFCDSEADQIARAY